MVRKRRKKEDEQPPWCYYCDRVFSDEQTLVQHQKAKHFKCTTCHKRLTSAGGLRVHCHQVHRFALEKVPFAKPGKDSMDLEVFGMAGVPEGAMPGDPPPDDGSEAKSLRTEAVLVPAHLPPPGATAAGAVHLLAPQQHFMQPVAMQPHFMPQPPQAVPGAPLQFAPMPFPGGMPPPMLRPPPGVAPPPGFMLPPGVPQQPLPGQMQAHRPPQPLFPAGSGGPAGPPPGLGPPPQAQPLFPAGAGPPPQAQQAFSSGQGPASQASTSGVPGQLQPALPAGQGMPVAPHEPEPAKGPGSALFPGGSLAAAQQPAGGLPASAAPQAPRPQHMPTSQHAPERQDMAGAHQMPVSQHAAVPPHLQAHTQLQSPAGSMTPNGNVHMMPQTALDGALLDTSNPAVIWKAIDMSMEESRAQHAKYQQKLSRATQAGMC